MRLREALESDADELKDMYLRAFDESEAATVAAVALRFLSEESADPVLSLLAEEEQILGHVSFSPVYLSQTHRLIGYLLAPLAVHPDFQKKGIGSQLVKLGLDRVSSLGAGYVFVYGDPKYYERFGFEANKASPFIPPHPLQYPYARQGMILNENKTLKGGSITCSSAFDDPNMW